MKKCKRTFRSLLMHRTRNLSGPFFQKTGARSCVKGMGNSLRIGGQLCPYVLINSHQGGDVWGFSTAGSGSIRPTHNSSGQLIYSFTVDALGVVIVRYGDAGDEQLIGYELIFSFYVNGLAVEMTWDSDNSRYIGNNPTLHTVLDDAEGQLFCITVTGEDITEELVFHAATHCPDTFELTMLRTGVSLIDGSYYEDCEKLVFEGASYCPDTHEMAMLVTGRSLDTNDYKDCGVI